MRITSEQANGEVIGNDQIVHASGYSEGREPVALRSAGGVEINEIAPTVGPNTPSIGRAWRRGRNRCFSFNTFTFGFFSEGWWWWNRWKWNNTLLDLEHSVSEVKSLHIRRGEADFIKGG